TGQTDQAEALFARAVELAAAFPDFEWAAISYADIASRQCKWTEALRRWEIVRNQFPHYCEGWIRSAEALAHVGRTDDAVGVLQRAIELFPEEISLPRWLALGRRGWDGSGQWRPAKYHRRRTEFSAYLSIFDDW